MAEPPAAATTARSEEVTAVQAQEVGANLLTLQNLRHEDEPPPFARSDDDDDDELEDEEHGEKADSPMAEEGERKEPAALLPEADREEAERVWAEVSAARQHRRHDGRRALLHARFPHLVGPAEPPPPPPRRSERERVAAEAEAEEAWTETCSRTTCRAQRQVLVAHTEWRAPLLAGWVLSWASVAAFALVQALGRWLA